MRFWFLVAGVVGVLTALVALWCRVRWPPERDLSLEWRLRDRYDRGGGDT